MNKPFSVILNRNHPQMVGGQRKTQQYQARARIGDAAPGIPEDNILICATHIRLGDIVFVGVPGEMFARLGLELRRRSPFRHTCIIGLANENIGYIPDRKAYADGGYQTWMGRHSKLEVGTGEAMVDQAVAMLDALYDAAPRRTTSPLASSTR